ncbi:MAG: cystathionine gamma-synthase [Planctomycetota bacterium]|jgi:cystathionine gamma-synthase
MSANPSSRTRTVRAGIETDSQHGAIVPPLHLSTNFSFAGFDQKRAYDYSRSGNPTRDLLGEALAELEGGVGAVVTSSGMSAVTLVLQLLQPEDLLLAPHDCYGGTYRAFSALAARGHFKLAFVDQNDSIAMETVLRRRPRMIWAETPSNPLLRIVDLAGLARLARRHGALLVADNTFLSPALQQPIGLGADRWRSSCSPGARSSPGHSDVVGGAVVAKTEELHERMVYWANCLGLTGSPFDSFLTLRGLRSLHARMRSHQENAALVARLLTDHAAVSGLYYPGLRNHPGHEIAQLQQNGFGAMLSFELAGGVPAVKSFLDGLNCFSLAESLGGVESLVAHPATMTHSAMDEAARREAGISDSLLRLSIGIEDGRDLLKDLEAGLARALRTCAAV